MKELKMTSAEQYIHMVRLHNLPKNSALCQILHFLWESIDFESEEAYIRTYSYKNAIVGFTQRIFADNAVQFCNGRSLYGRVISVHPATGEDLERVIAESNESGPDAGPSRLGRHKMIPEPEDPEEEDELGQKEGDAGNAFMGLNAYSDSESDGDMDLAIPDFFKKGPHPDTVDFRHSSSNSSGSAGQNSGQMVSATATSSSDQSPEGNGEDNDDIEIIKVSAPSATLKRNSQDDSFGVGQSKAKGTANLFARARSVRVVEKKQPADPDIAYRSPLLQQAGKIPIPTRPGQPPPPPARFQQTRAHFQPGPPRFFPAAATGANTMPIGLRNPHLGGLWRPPPPLTVNQLNPPPAVAPRNKFPIARPTRFNFPPKTGPGNVPRAAGPKRHIPQQSSAVDPSKLVRFEVHVAISTKHCYLSWTTPPNVDSQQVEVVTGQDVLLLKKRLGKLQYFLLDTEEGHRYQATVRGFDLAETLVALGKADFRAIYSTSELQKLHNLAVNFCSGEKYQFDILHRCKPRDFFDKIYEQPGGRRMMMPYLKDENGHRGSAINSMIKGLFFSTLLITDNLPDKSPFGDVQMTMDAHAMLNCERTNWYFADFYCNQAFAGVQGVSSSLHYITVVVTLKESETDKFCKKHLIRLEPRDNKFLQVHRQNDKLFYLVATRPMRDLLVEVYYTEPVSLFEAKAFNRVATIGKGSSRPGGLPNNRLCKMCNFPQ